LTWTEVTQKNIRARACMSDSDTDQADNANVALTQAISVVISPVTLFEGDTLTLTYSAWASGVVWICYSSGTSAVGASPTCLGPGTATTITADGSAHSKCTASAATGNAVSLTWSESSQTHLRVRACTGNEDGAQVDNGYMTLVSSSLSKTIGDWLPWSAPTKFMKIARSSNADSHSGKVVRVRHAQTSLDAVTFLFGRGLGIKALHSSSAPSPTPVADWERLLSVDPYSAAAEAATAMDEGPSALFVDYGDLQPGTCLSKQVWYAAGKLSDMQAVEDAALTAATLQLETCDEVHGFWNEECCNKGNRRLHKVRDSKEEQPDCQSLQDNWLVGCRAQQCQYTSPSVPSTALVGSASNLVFTTHPGPGTLGIPLSSQPAVTIQDSNGNTVVKATNVHLSKKSGPGDLGGTVAVATSNGVAIYHDVKLSQAGTYVLRAEATIDGSVMIVESTNFDIVAQGSQGS